MADVITSTQAVLQQDVISATVLEVLTAEAVMPGSVDDKTAFVGPGMDRLSLPEYGNFAVTKKVPGTPVDAITNAFSESELLLDEHAVIQFLLERRADLQSKVRIADAYIRQAAKDLAAQMDADIIAELEGSSNTQSLAAVGILAKADVLDARKRMNNADISQADRFAVVNPDQASQLLNISEFTRVDEAGGSGALRNGEIGKLFGFTWLESSQATSGTVSFYHKSGIVHAKQKELSVDSDKDLPNLADRWSLDMLYGQKLVDSDARCFKYA